MIPAIFAAGMAGTHREAAQAAAKRFGIPDIQEVQALVQRADIDLVYIATPAIPAPPQALLALRAGKHVICEKPLALTVAQADELIAAAAERDLLIIANLMQRYNPLFETVRSLVQSKILGEPLHAFFENYAADEGLPAQHRFWDRGKSGGIFVEHGVHFFDLFEGWLGEGRVAAAQRTMRPGTQIEEQVHCTVRYGDTTLVNFYHGFHQPGRLDRQELRLVFERGDVSLYEWVPCRVRIRAVADEKNTRALCELFPGARLDVSAVYSPNDRACLGRHKTIDVYQSLEMAYGEGGSKLHRYGELLRALLADQVAWIRDRAHPRRITEGNGRASLALAIEATRMADAAAANP